MLLQSGVVAALLGGLNLQLVNGLLHVVDMLAQDCILLLVLGVLTTQLTKLRLAH